MLSIHKRSLLPKKSFSLPTVRKYPVISRATAMSALRLSSLHHKQGQLSTGDLQKIHTKATNFLRSQT